MLGSVVVQYSN